jgi:hypothetical protein
MVMSQKITIKRSELQRIKEITRSVGAYISGRKSDDYGIGRVFWNTLTINLFQRIYKAYVEKSYGAADDLGNTWPALAESTIQMKSRPSGALRSARSRERKSLRGLKPLKDSRRLIMRETDRLINSLKPAITRGQGFYTPRKDQMVYTSTRAFTIGTEVEYAKYHNKTRPVIPDNAGEWVTASINEAIVAATARMVEAYR